MNVFELFATLSLDSSGYDAGLDDASGKAQSIGSKLAQGLGTAGKVAGVAISAAATGVTALTTAIVDGAGKTAAYGDNIDKMSQKMGLSIEAYQEWDAIMQHSGTSIDAMQRSMLTLSGAVESGSEHFETLGLSLDDLASMSQEDIFSATITALQNMESGTERAVTAQKLLGAGAKELGALLNTSAEDTEEMRQRVHELGGVMSDEAVKSAAAYQDSLQDMQTAFGSLSRNLTSEFLPGIKSVMDGLAEIFTGGDGMALISEGIDDMVGNLTEQLPRFLEVGAGIIESIIQAITDNLPQLMDAGLTLLMQIMDGIVSNLPSIAEAALQVIKTLAQGIAQALPELIPSIVSVVGQIVETLVSNVGELIPAALALMIGLARGLIEAIPEIIKVIPQIITALVDELLGSIPQIIQAGIDLLTALVGALPEIIEAIVAAIPEIINGLVDAIIGSIPQIIQAGVDLLIALIQNLPTIITTIVSAIPQIISSIVEALIGNIDKIIMAGVQLFVALIENLPTIIIEIVKAIPQIIAAIVEAFIGLIGNIVDVGKRIVEGLWEGIKSMATWIADKVSGFFSGIVEGAKSLLGIHSPSKVFAGIGKNMAAGLGEGFDKAMDSVDRDIDNRLDFGVRTMSLSTSGASTGAGYGGAGYVGEYGSGGGDQTISVDVTLRLDDGTILQKFAHRMLPYLNNEAALAGGVLS